MKVTAEELCDFMWLNGHTIKKRLNQISLVNSVGTVVCLLGQELFDELGKGFIKCVGKVQEPSGEHEVFIPVEDHEIALEEEEEDKGKVEEIPPENELTGSIEDEGTLTVDEDENLIKVEDGD